ncbi:MAG TPA: hypothetical protein VGN23_01505 [Verrucomicrobiae bacterium]|jgi:hypothetical protein
MNPLIKKEVRVLLPGFLIGCELALFNALPGPVWGREYTELAGVRVIITFLMCPAIAIMIALNSFGVEVTTGTFTSLLAQPVERLKIWQTKILLLALALLMMGALWVGSTWILAVYDQNRSLVDPRETFAWMVLFVLAIYSGALWTVLLLRQAAAAFWFTVLIPAAIVVLFSAFDDGDNHDVLQGVMVVGLGLYTLAGLFFARWLFLRAQDVQWSGGTIAMPEMRGSPAWLLRLTAWRMTHPVLALCRKEFQLQQSQFIMAFVLAVLHLGVLVTRSLGHFHKNSTTEFILESFWWLWLVMPFMVGCTAIAEERKLGTHESQLCLPVKRRTQFMTKLAVVLSLSLVFGVAMPVLYEGGRILPDVHLWFISHSGWAEDSAAFIQLAAHSLYWKIMIGLDHFWPLLLATGAIAGIGLISFYISSLTRATLQALAPALGYLVILGFLMVQAKIETQAPDPLWGSNLIYFIGIPIFVLAFAILAYRNFRHLTVSLGLWLKNSLALAVTLMLVIVATTMTYHRFWEKLTPFEPPHGAARMSLSDPAKITCDLNEISVRLPDGRMWMDNFAFNGFANAIDFVLGNTRTSLATGSFLADSGWNAVVRSTWEMIGIKNDGTLWDSEKTWGTGKHGTFQEYENNLRQLVQFGTETNWRSIEEFSPGVLLIKSDGTLWRWGPDRFDARKKNWPGLRSLTPRRVGTESNWVGFVGSYLQASNGSIWAEDYFSHSTNNEKELYLGRGLTARQITHVAGLRSVAAVWGYFPSRVGISSNGSLCVWAQERYESSGQHGGDWEWIGTDFTIDTDTNWLAVASSQWALVTLKNDGTLWFWNLQQASQWEHGIVTTDSGFRDITPVRLGTHSDWITITSGDGYILALAADGSLWYWPVETPRFQRNENHEPLLDISHKPQLLGNVFADNSVNP